MSNLESQPDDPFKQEVLKQAEEIFLTPPSRPNILKNIALTSLILAYAPVEVVKHILFEPIDFIHDLKHYGYENAAKASSIIIPTIPIARFIFNAYVDYPLDTNLLQTVSTYGIISMFAIMPLHAKFLEKHTDKQES